MKERKKRKKREEERKRKPSARTQLDQITLNQFAMID